MNENPEKNKEEFSEEQQEVINEWMAKYATEEIPAEKRREGGPEIIELERMLEDFEQTHDLAALLTITNLTFEESLLHPTRKPAQLALNPIYAKLRTLKEETNITDEQYKELEVKRDRLSQAVGMLRSDNTVDHSER